MTQTLTEPETTAVATMDPIAPARLQRAKKAYTTRFLAERIDEDPTGYFLQTLPESGPRPGDIVLARVERLGHLQKLEGPGSRRQSLFPGDEVLVAFGNRYAPDAVLAEVPADLSPCHLVAAGGVAGQVTASHGTVGRPTSLLPIGLLCDADGRIGLSKVAPRAPRAVRPAARAAQPLLFVTLGSSMNSGKSTAAACLVRGLSNGGMRVAAGKVTGTGAGGDPRLFHDAGSIKTLDFTDFGYPTTFKVPFAEILNLFHSMVEALSEESPDATVLEIADGIYQGETRRLLNDPSFQSTVDQILFCAGDALGATAGVNLLREAGLEPAAVSGMVTVSPLASAEAAEALDIPVLETYSLCEPETAAKLLPTD